MTKFRTRLIFGLLIAILLVLVSLGLFIGFLLKGFYIEEMEKRLGNEASLGARIMEGLPEEEWQEQAEELASRLEVRVTIIKEDLEIAAETESNLSDREILSYRSEIENAEETGASSIRYSETFGDDMLFYAYPFQYGEGDQGFVRLAVPVERIDQVNSKIWTFLAISFSLAFIIIVSVSYRIANQLTRPIGKVTEVAHELAKGNFKARTYESGGGEIGQLTRSMNILAYNLDQITTRSQTQQERLEALIDHMGSGLIFINDRGDIALINQFCKDIFHADTDQWLQRLYYEVIEEKDLIELIQRVFFTEGKVHGQAKVDTPWNSHYYDVYGAPIIGEKEKLRGIVVVLHDITELKKLEQIRRDFVANVSHELKTPVTSLKGFTETLLDGAIHDEKAREEFLHIIWKESDRLQALISDLLDLSKIEHEYFHLNWQTVHIAEVGKEVVDLLRPKAEQKDIRLTSQLEEEAVMDGDAMRIKQMMINLINNAIVYTPAGGEINVAGKTVEGSIVIEVADSGIGIDEQELPRIFERFYRVNKDRSRNSGGTGLGLAIVKHLVEAHHGRIEVNSEKDNGTTFTIYLPIYQQR